MDLIAAQRERQRRTDREEPTLPTPEAVAPPGNGPDFICKITKCADATGYAECVATEGDPPTPTVPTGAKTLKVFLAVHPFVKKDDFIFVRAFRGTDIKYYMTRPVFDPLSPYATPVANLAPAESPALAVQCTDTVTVP